MRSHAGVAATMFKALADRGINIQAISTSEIKVSVLIDEDETELAVRVLHTAYGLDAEEHEISPAPSGEGSGWGLSSHSDVRVADRPYLPAQGQQ